MRDTGIDLRKDRQALQRLREAAEKAKCELSTTVQTQISLPFITSVEGEGPKHLDISLKRAKLEELIGDLIDKTAESVERAMKDAKLTKDGIHEVILVGGSTRIPAVQELVKRLTGKEPRQGVNPDEVVAMGAAIQAAVLGDEMRDMVLLDVTPLTLGIETLGGVMTKLIERNTTIPTRKSETFSTASDFQTTVEVHVLQGEREMAGDNKTLGTFHLAGIPPAPRGVPQIDVTFDIDANGIVNVSAKDKATNKEQSITITGSGQLADDEIDQMVKDAEAHAAEDKKLREVVEAKNEADTVAYQLEKTLNDLGDKVTDDEKKPVRDKINEVREAAKGDDVERIRAAMSAAQEAFAPLASKAYQAATAAEGPQAQEQAAQAEGTTGKATTPPADDDVIDAEFTAEDEE